MNENAFCTLVVNAELTPLARALSVNLSEAGGSGMFITGLSADGNEPATFFVSSGYIDEQIASLLGDPQLLHAACVSAGANVTLSQCQLLVDTSDVSSDDPFIVFDRLGLQLVRPVDI